MRDASSGDLDLRLVCSAWARTVSLIWARGEEEVELTGRQEGGNDGDEVSCRRRMVDAAIVGGTRGGLRVLCCGVGRGRKEAATLHMGERRGRE